jgi:hypothetical protein
VRPASVLALASIAALAAACDGPPPKATAPRASSSAALPVAPPHAEGAGAEPVSVGTPAQFPKGPPPARSGSPSRPPPAPSPTAL